jgi:hypothetical protein
VSIRNVYLDCEFLRGDPTTAGLVSLALTDEQDVSYYAVNRGMDVGSVLSQAWMVENVWGSLPTVQTSTWPGFDTDLDYAHPDVHSVNAMQGGIAAYFENTGADETHLYAYYGGQDIFRLHSLWDHDWSVMPDTVPCWFYDLKGLAVQRGNPRLPEQTKGAHNALADARWNREVHRFLLRATRGRAA